MPRPAHFPVPSDDVLAAWNAAGDIVGQPAERLFLGGASAGGNLVTGVAARLRDGAPGARPAGLIPVYPALHPNGGAPGEPLDEASPGAALSLNFAGSAEALSDPHAFPGNGGGDGYPPTLVVVCELDGLRPSGEAFARSVEEAGGDVSLHVEPGAGHAHIDQPGDAAALRTIERIVGWIRERLAA